MDNEWPAISFPMYNLYQRYSSTVAYDCYYTH